jgi:hypothetical protein
MDNSAFMQNSGTAIAVVIGIILFILIIMIFVIRKSVSHSKSARNFGPDFARRTGLMAQGNEYVGTYKGFSVSIKNNLTFDYAGIRNQKYRMYPRLHCRLTATGKNFPYTVLREKLNMLLYTDQRIMDFVQGKYNELPPEFPDLEHKLPRVHIYSTDRVTADKIANDTELQRLLIDWYYCDVRIAGNEIYLLMDNEHSLYKYGRRLYDCGYWVQALDIVVRVAQIA